MPCRIGIGTDTKPFMRRSLCAAVPDLGSGDDPFVTVSLRTCAQAGQVGACFGLGVTHSAGQFSASYRRKELELVLFGAVAHDHRRHRGHREIRARDAPVLELPHQQVLIGGPESQAAIFRRPVETSPPGNSWPCSASSDFSAGVTFSRRKPRTSVNQAFCAASSSKSTTHFLARCTHLRAEFRKGT